MGRAVSLSSLLFGLRHHSTEACGLLGEARSWCWNVSLENSCKWMFSDISTAAAAAKSLQSCPTLCDPIDGSPPGSSIPGILQARILEWVAISFSNAWKWKGKVKSLSHVRLLATPWTAAHQAPPSMGFSRQEYWSGWGAIAFSGYIHYQCLYLCGGPQLPPSSPGDPLRPAGRSGPALSQITAFALILSVCEILCAPFKKAVSIP